MLALSKLWLVENVRKHFLPNVLTISKPLHEDAVILMSCIARDSALKILRGAGFLMH